jgi:mannosylglycerate hydrolase MGH1-like protein
VNRRWFLAAGSALATTRALGESARAQPGLAPQFTTQHAGWQSAYDKALAVLADNVQTLPHFAKPVLIEGAAYQGIWLECGPHESLLYRKFRPDVAKDSHRCFFALQRADGQFPYSNKLAGTGYGQIQMAVPIAATAWELAQATADEQLLEEAYGACAKWDAWLLRFRNVRGTGLTEGFCTYDTGQDNSPRWSGIPPQCPNQDAKRYVPGMKLPRLCPDLSATTYGGRIALAHMAQALGRTADAARWQQQAEDLRGLIIKRLYVPEQAAFYDLDADNAYVRIRCDTLSRVCGEHVVDQTTFESLWSRQLHHREAFWSSLPLPSVALDDPLFVRPIPSNSWGGAAQALTAMRTGRWFDHYGKSAAHAELMHRWCEALMADGRFAQQADPQTGRFTAGDPPGYSPAALVMVDFTWRLAGICESGRHLHWNVRPGHAVSQGAHFSVRTDAGHRAQMIYDAHGAQLSMDGRTLLRLEGGAARVITTESGRLHSLMGIDEKEQHLRVLLPGAPARNLNLSPGAPLSLTRLAPTP